MSTPETGRQKWWEGNLRHWWQKKCAGGVHSITETKL